MIRKTQSKLRTSKEDQVVPITPRPSLPGGCQTLQNGWKIRKYYVVAMNPRT